MKKYDIVYILREDIRPNELRYSLRSVEKFMTHGNVWFVGGKPAGLEPDNAIYMHQTGNLKWERAKSSIIAACKCEEISDMFWLFNDDFFLLKPFRSTKALFGGTLRDHILHIESRYNNKKTGYTRALRYCEKLLEDAGYPTFDYALHVPMLIDKKKMLEALETFPDCPMFRSIYGNFAEVGGMQHDDVKTVSVVDHLDKSLDMVSTNDSSFNYGVVGKEIRKLFPEACKYEQTVRKKVLQFKGMANLP